MGTVRTTFTSEDKEIRKTLEDMNKEMIKLREQNKKLAQESKEGHEKTRQSMTLHLVGLKALDVAYDVASRAVRGYINALQDSIKKTDDVTISIDEQMRKLQVLHRMTPPETRRAEKAIAAIADRQAVPFNRVTATVQQLTSSGFDMKDAIFGGSAEELLRLQNATNSGNIDPLEISKAAVMFMNATKTERTFKNLRKVATVMQNLVTTDLELPDLIQYAADAGSVTEMSKADFATQLAMMSQLRGVMPGDQAATQLRNTVVSMSSAASFKKRTDALKLIDLRPEDIDMVGETFPEALGRLKKALEGVDEATQNIVLTRMFGRENLAGPIQLMKELPNLDPLIDKLGNERSYDEAVAIATSGHAAAKRRADTRHELSYNDPNRIPTSTIATELDTQLKKAGFGVYSRWMTWGKLNALNATGMIDPAAAVYSALPPMEESDAQKMVDRVMGEVTGNAHGNTRATSGAGVGSDAVVRELTAEIRGLRNDIRGRRPAPAPAGGNR